MKLDTLQKHWNALGEEDPLWAILSSPGKRGGVWNLEEFLATGPVEVAEVLDELRARGIEPPRGRALDFGCGVGRLTQALAGEFDRCDGVDLAASMIEQAGELNQRGDRCRFHHNTAPDLRLFADQTFDFVLSLLVFQHMEPGLMKGYLPEVVRVLRPAGIAYFNVPDSFLLGGDLPTAAIDASIACRRAPEALAPGEVAALEVAVTNVSGIVWPGSAQLLVGNHWLTGDGALVVHDDGRAPIEGPVPAGVQREVSLTVVAPEAPGEYLLEVDVLQEHKGWFSQLGSRTLRLPVSVQAERAPAAAHVERAEPGADGVVAPKIEMHVLSREETVAVIEDAGGVVLDVIARDRCGPLTPSFDYVVGRAPVAGGRRPAPDLRAPAEPASPLASPARPLPEEGLWGARATADARANVVSFRLQSRWRRLGPASVLIRGALRRGLLEVLYRQTQFNRATNIRVDELERQVEQLQAEVRALEEGLAEVHGRGGPVS